MDKKELVSTIRKMKGIRPSEEWRVSVRNELLSSIHEHSKESIPEAAGLFGLQKLAFARAFKPAFTVVTLLLALIAGAFVLVPRSELKQKVAYNLSAPEKEAKVQETSVVEKPIVDEKIDVLQYGYENENQEQGEAEEESSLAFADTEERKVAPEETALVKEDGEEAKLSYAEPVVKKISKPAPVEAFEPDFKIGLKKERGYGDQVLGGFLMAGDEDEDMK